MSEIEINEYVRTEDGKIYEHIKDGDDYYYSSPTYFENYGEIPPREIRYDMLQDGYKDLIYDEDELEYRYKNYPMEFWEISNHHLNDEVEIIKE